MFFERQRILIAIRITCGLAIALILLLFPLYKIDFFLYDLRFRLNPFTHKSQKVEIITIDQSTLQIHKGEPHINAHIQLLNRLLKERPAAIYYVMDPKLIAGTDIEKSTFTETIHKFRSSIFYMKELPNSGEEYKTIIGPEFPGLRYTPGYLSTDFQHYAEDSVARRALLIDGYVYSQVKAAQSINHISDFDQYRGNFQRGTSTQIYVNYQPTGTYKPTLFDDVISEKYLPGMFKDKVVLIGLDTKSDYTQYVKTVYDNKNFAMSNVEAQANIVATMIDNSGIILFSGHFTTFITLLFTAIVLFSILRLSPLQGLQVIVSSIALYCVIAWALFCFWGIAIEMAHPLIAAFTCYYFFIPYRLIQEAKRSWELTQKNRLLTQVEELKNNFLSMMSHDLKTPLARIQGMADIALAKSESLSTEQNNAIQTIKRSAEELTEFITNILDLSRVESQQIKLNLQPKDINSVLEDVISKAQYLAEQKNILVIKELEPLFTVKVDGELMRQVFSNLVENAIKYSPEGSKVLVSTEEVNGMIIVQVADQGIGITEKEIKNIFTKFYRARNVKNSQIKGSGLGLYLAKYFIELHKGRINVESIPQQGSTFTVEIPMNH